jgi:hypothetical protein
MQLIIDAWLERPAPFLQILDVETRRPVARFEGVALQRLLSEGIVTPEDLNTANEVSQKNLLKELLVAACCKRFRNRHECKSCSASNLCPYKNRPLS